MDPDHPYYDVIVKDPRYAAEPKPEEFPMFESLKLTIERTLPYWNNVIVPQIKAGKRILVPMLLNFISFVASSKIS
jgi:2,3-bisphosphoglycerate-dependent phosphoglycerate mutase